VSAADGRLRPRYLHLATHGFFEAPSAQVRQLHWPRDDRLPFGLAREYRAYARNPLLLSGLALAGANASPEKGLLRAEEVADLVRLGLRAPEEKAEPVPQGGAAARSHPALWAAFVLSGDTGPLPEVQARRSP